MTNMICATTLQHCSMLILPSPFHFPICLYQEEIQSFSQLMKIKAMKIPINLYSYKRVFLSVTIKSIAAATIMLLTAKFHLFSFSVLSTYIQMKFNPNRKISFGYINYFCLRIKTKYLVYVSTCQLIKTLLILTLFFSIHELELLLYEIKGKHT